MKITTIDLGDLPFKLRDVRIGLGITQAALAEAIGVNQRTISRLETGQYQMSLTQATSIATALGFELGAVLSHATEPMVQKPAGEDADRTAARVRSIKASELLKDPEVLARLAARQQASAE